MNTNTPTLSQHQHTKKTGHVTGYENVEVIDIELTDTKLRIKEMPHILKKEPTLNKQMNSQSNHEIKTILIQAYTQHRK
jgi:hypothetical protein